MLTQAQQRAINALGEPGAVLILPSVGGPFVTAGEDTVKVQERTFHAILELGLIESEQWEKTKYVLTSNGKREVQDKRPAGTPCRRT